MRVGKALLMVVLGILLGSMGMAFALDPLDQAQLFLEMGNTNQAIALLQPLLKTEREEERLGAVVELLDEIFSERGEIDRAIAVLETYITRFPETPRAYLFRYWIAKHEEERQNFEKTLTILEDMVHRLPPEDPFGLKLQVLSDLAYYLYYRKGDYSRALAVYKEIVALSEDPEERLQAKMSIGSCYEEMDRLQEALKVYEEVMGEAPGSFYERWAGLRILYLTTPPEETARTKEELAHRLAEALKRQDLVSLKRLAKKGDFWIGVIFSEFDVDDAGNALAYIAEYLPRSPHLKVQENLEPRNGEWSLRVEEWGDPEYNILYLVLGEGRYGWEWKGLILSSTALETYQDDSSSWGF